MACNSICSACENLVISEEIIFDSTDNVLTITIPNRPYFNSDKVCIFLAQELPQTTTISATVAIAINGTTATYNLVGADCLPLNAYLLHSRTRYSTKIVTNGAEGVFRLMSKLCLTRQTHAMLLEGD